MYMGADEWLIRDILASRQLNSHIVHPKNVAKRGIGSGDGRYEINNLFLHIYFNDCAVKSHEI